MKNLCSLLFGLLLTVCLTFYGNFSMAMAGGSAVFSVEICADGVTKNVLIDADGNPVQPAQDCPECLRCCQASGGETPTFCTAALSFVLLDMEADGPSAQDPILNKRNILPVPRGPPAMHLSMYVLPDLIRHDQANNGNEKRSDGRPLLKDAYV